MRTIGSRRHSPARSGARVESTEAVSEQHLDLPNFDARASLPGAGVPRSGASHRWRRAKVELSWPVESMGPPLPNVMASTAGNLFELQQLSGLRLMALRLPQAFRDAYQGPQFGTTGTRKRAGVDRLPLIGTIHQAQRRALPAGDGGSSADARRGGIVASLGALVLATVAENDFLHHQSGSALGLKNAQKPAGTGFQAVLGPKNRSVNARIVSARYSGPRRHSGKISPEDLVVRH